MSGARTAVRPRYSDCREAAAAVKGAEHGPAAIRELRPRGVTGLVRSRPPLAVLLWLAARQGLLVRTAAADLVLLEPPGEGVGHRPAQRSAVLCRTVERWWELLVFMSGPAIGLALGAGLALAVPGTAVAVLALVLVVLGWTAVWLVPGVVRLILFLYESFERSARRSPDLARSALHPHWRLTLVHAADTGRARELLDAALRLVDELAAAGADRQAEDEAGVVCREASVTRTAVRAVVRAAGRIEELPGPEPIVVVVLREPAEQRSDPPTVGAAGISVILLGLVTAIFILPVFVAGYEKSACGGGPACRGRPAGYGAALSWLLGLLPLVDDGPTPAAGLQAKTFGALFVLLVAVVALCVIVAIRRMADHSRRERVEVHRQLSGSGLPAPAGSPARPAGPTSSGPDVFINYRKEDGGWVVAIYHHLCDTFDGVFRDSRSIRAGENFEQALLDAVRTAKVVLVVIGPGWIDATKDGRRRLDDEEDWVRREIAEALAHDVPVVPVLVDGAARLTDAELPEAVDALRRAQYVDLRHHNDRYDLAKLADEIEAVVPGLRRRTEDGGRARNRSEIDAFLRARLAPQHQRGGNRDHLVDVLAATVGRTERLLAVTPCRVGHAAPRPALLVVTDHRVRVVELARAGEPGSVVEIAGADLHSVDLQAGPSTGRLTLRVHDDQIVLSGILRSQAVEIAALLRDRADHE